ncbi:thioredoxin domain-containing protein 17-like [Pectinophora gossypiella]|uniref:Thioredoxin domain-containing protein 17 n=1 Tax=Pectinophora gossypiella TaxID=13191 RepID=A0A1E1WI61_PECGO|nr:thioredoxin domain-containing protein 17-like [Pectinophora gossypiella]
MVFNVEVKGFDDFVSYTEKIKPDGPDVYFYFSGTKIEGKSWCPDCIEAEAVITPYLQELNKNIVFVYVDVGDMPYWKKADCPFRTDTRTKLMVIPTLIKWKGVQRLEGSQCNKRDLLQMMFEEEE